MQEHIRNTLLQATDLEKPTTGMCVPHRAWMLSQQDLINSIWSYVTPAGFNLLWNRSLVRKTCRNHTCGSVPAYMHKKSCFFG